MRRFPASLVLLLAAASTLDAQVDEALLTRRWKTDNFWAETYDRPLVTGTGNFEGSTDDFQMFHWVSVGRIKFDQEDLDPAVWLGYKANTISMTTDRDFLNHAYGDVALGVAAQLGSLGGGWSWSAGAAIGTANDGRWDNSDALYGTASVDFAYRKDGGLPLHVGLGYDGNRTFFPNVPLPHFLMELTPDPTLTLLIGFPKAELIWRPTRWLIFSVEGQLSTQATARVDVDLGSGFTIFADVVRRIDAFHLRDVEHDRLFMEVHTAEVGVRWVSSWMDVGLSVGTTFSQRYFSGPHILDRDKGDSIESLPFVAITIPGVNWAPPLSAGLKR